MLSGDDHQSLRDVLRKNRRIRVGAVLLCGSLAGSLTDPLAGGPNSDPVTLGIVLAAIVGGWAAASGIEQATSATRAAGPRREL
jgi:hypothetical protein